MKALLSLLALLIISCAGQQAEGIQTFVLEAGEFELDSIPVYADLTDGITEENQTVCLQTEAGTIPAQTENIEDGQRIWWLASVPAGEPSEYTLAPDAECNEDDLFEWQSLGEESARLNYAGRPLLQYEKPAFDPDDIEGTKKPFHHLFDPAGDRPLTKGPGGLYSHHRGVFFGYNHVYINGDRVDIWHANDGERSEHAETIKEMAGPVMGGHLARIQWKDRDGKPFIEETREVRVFRKAENETVVDFRSVLQAIDGPVALDGDRQHAGVHFRAAQDVADQDDQATFIRPPNLSHLPADHEIGGNDMMDLPWNAMHFSIDRQSYTVTYMSHPSNPAGAEMSERRYGRFGEFFPYEVTEEYPLEVNYRFWITAGSPPSVESIERNYHAYSSNTGVPLH